ncbi:MAG: hypothetical protein Harvfovirus57_2 [Harvfovirus sp.]|uniref:Uncharacterized protein n=1 Tax=Harvfovirus sp. TaxID=2487768 RepID=A0A3G5A7B5_9VIRU|nr:MAG: hypothetical protein Harvfovirus57_2 [Harvfovirus sp.]
MDAIFTKRKIDDEQKKSFHPIAAMLLTYDVVGNCLIKTRDSEAAEDVLYAFILAGSNVFPRLMEHYPVERLEKFRQDRLSDSFLDDCRELPIKDRPHFIWRKILLAGQAIDDKICTTEVDKFNLDEKKILVLISYTNSLDSLALPMVRYYKCHWIHGKLYHVTYVNSNTFTIKNNLFVIISMTT